MTESKDISFKNSVTNVYFNNHTSFVLAVTIFVCVLSGHQGQYPVLLDHRNEYGECHVSDLPETVPGTF